MIMTSRTEVNKRILTIFLRKDDDEREALNELMMMMMARELVIRWGNLFDSLHFRQHLQ